MNINKKTDRHQISPDCVSCDIVFVALAQHENFVSPVDLAIDLGGVSASVVRQKLKELGDAVETDGIDRWRISKAVANKSSYLPKSDLDEQDLAEAKVIKQEILDICRQFFAVIGEKLKYVRDRKLYRFESKTFAQWCEDELGIKRRHAYNLINAHEVFQNVHNCAQNLPLPTSEYQIRHLAQLEPEEQVAVWMQAIEDNDGKIPTGSRVKQIVRQVKKPVMESSIKYETLPTQSNAKSNYPKLEIDSKYGKIERYLIPIKNEELKRKIEQYAQKVGAATIEGAIARLLEQVKDE